MKDNKQKIQEILESNPQGFIVREIAKLSNLARQTVAVVLAELRGAELINERSVGQAKLITWGVK